MKRSTYDGPRGAYGLIVREGSGIDRNLLAAAGEHWTPWTIRTRVVPAGADLELSRFDDYVRDNDARITLRPDGFMTIDRETRTSVLTLPRQPTAAELVHPYLAHTGAALAWWRGHAALHAATVARHGTAIALLGHRGHGKTSTAARLVSRGWSIIADDLAVFDGAAVLAGPRIADLRQETAEAWGMGNHIGVVGQRERWRARTLPVSPATPLGAIVELAWGGNNVRVESMSVDARIRALVQYRAFDVVPRDSNVFLKLLSLPSVRLERPRLLERIDEGIDAALSAVGLNSLAEDRLQQ